MFPFQLCDVQLCVWPTSWPDYPGALWPVGAAPGGVCGTRPSQESVASGLGGCARPAPRCDECGVVKWLGDLEEVRAHSSSGVTVPESELKGP